MGGQSDTAVVYVDKNGKFLIRGELDNMSVDPFAKSVPSCNRDSPSMGPENAKVTLIEFADFECPSCRQLDLILRDSCPSHPEIRLVLKHFPLTEIHPWAMTAAIASPMHLRAKPRRVLENARRHIRCPRRNKPHKCMGKDARLSDPTRPKYRSLPSLRNQPRNRHPNQRQHSRRPRSIHNRHPNHLRKRSPSRRRR